MGRGRHARLLAALGAKVFGVDRSIDALRAARAAASGAGQILHVWCADLTSTPLPPESFELIVVSRFLQRDLFPAIGAALAPGGVVLYETFTAAQRALGVGPTSPDHLLEPGELAGRFPGFEQLFYEEVSAPEAVARLAARKRQRAFSSS